MSSGWNQCYASCPPMTVTIQPPPFTLNIPGPALYCPDQPLCIDQCNPCAPIQYSEGMTRGGYTSVATGVTSGFSNSSMTSQRSMARAPSGCSPCQRF